VEPQVTKQRVLGLQQHRDTAVQQYRLGCQLLWAQQQGSAGRETPGD
jgi:hypothetical protein